MIQINGIAVNKLRKHGIFTIEKAPMSAFTTFKIGGNADILVNVKSEDEVSFCINLAKKLDLRLTVIGNGSNLLVDDEGVDGIVMRLAENFSNVWLEGESVYATAGVSMGKFDAFLKGNLLTGGENFVGIPARIGGMIAMNAGAYGKSISDIIEYVRVVSADGIEIIENGDCDFSYRNSRFLNSEYVIVGGKFNFKFGDLDEINFRRSLFMSKRKETQPLNLPSAGCVFKSGILGSTGKLIDELGLKGMRVGGASVSTKHGGFIVNDNNATFADVKNLIDSLQEKVYNVYGENLQLELKEIKRKKKN